MHSYSINSNERSKIQLLLAGASILLTWLIKINLDFPWWFEDPSIFGIYGVLYLIFNRYLWKKKILHSIGLIHTPDINGEWTGFLKSSFDNFVQEYEAKIVVIQRWTSIDISFSTQTSNGRSVIAAIEMGNNEDADLTYTYLNDPVASAHPQINMHKGTSILCFSDNLSKADGEYYGGRGRMQYGEVHFKRTRIDEADSRVY